MALVRKRPRLVGEVIAGREWRVVSTVDSYGCTLGFLDRSRYFSFQVAPQLYSRS
jgi:hypothetical protein